MLKKISKNLTMALMTLAMLITLLPAVTITAKAANIWDGSVAAAFAGGDGSAGNPYQIATGGQLAYLASLTNVAGSATLNQYYKLTADIDLNNRQWTPIGIYPSGGPYPFYGTFDGDGHVISNLSYIVNDATINRGGLFGEINEATIKNVGVENATISMTGYNSARMGILVGEAVVNSGTCSIINCYTTGSVSSPVTQVKMGGLVGYCYSTSFANCYSTASVSSTYNSTSSTYIGGLVGNTANACPMINCFSTGNVSAVSAASAGGIRAGGLVGYYSVASGISMTICYATGVVTSGANSYVGGLVGQLANGTIANCYFKNDAMANGVGNVSSGTDTSAGMASATMQLAAFVTTLNTHAGSVIWKTDAVLNRNGGYPVIIGVGTGIDPNAAPTFVGGVTTLTVNANATATDIRGLVHASDTDAGQTLTWSQHTGPSHGTLSIAGATASSGGADITPGGTITYTPTAGYSGSDSFIVQVTDTIATVTRTINVTVRSNNATLANVAGQTDGNPGGQGGTGIGDAIAWELSLEQSTISRGSITVAPNATFNLYSNDGFTAEITGVETLTLTPGAVTTAYIKVTAQDTTATKYYAVALTRAATFDFEANTSPIADDNALTPAATVTQAKNGETISIASTGGAFVIGSENALIGSDYASFGGNVMLADILGSPYSTSIRVSLQSGHSFDLNSFGLFDINLHDHDPNSILLISSSGATLDAGALINYGSNDYGVAFVDISDNAGFQNITHFELFASGSGMQLALDAIVLTNMVLPILSDNAGLTSVAGQADATPGAETGADVTHAITWGIDVTNAKSSLVRADIAVAANATFNLYSNAAFTTEITGADTTALTSGSATTVYIKVTAQDTTTIKYYAVTVTRAPALPMVTLAVNNASIGETDGSATVTATLSNTFNADVTVNLAYSGTATGGGTDYTPSAASITIPTGSTSGYITLTATADTKDEDDETVIIDIIGVTNGTENGTQQQTVTITDDDPLPSISVSNASVAEGDSGTVNLTFTVTLSAVSGKTVTVDFATADGTAMAGSDYVSSSGSLTFSPGETTKTVSVEVNGDFTDEGNETVLLNLENPANAAIADSQGSGTITNDDGPPTITNATYNCSTGVLIVTGTSFLANGGGADIDASTISVTGEGGVTYTLTDTSDVERDSVTQFTLTLSADDKAAVNQLLNKNGTASTSGTLYNVAAAAGWATAVPGAADLTDNGINVSNVAVPTITSAVYDAITGTLTVTGTGYLPLSGAGNDIDASKLTITGEGGTTYTLTDTADVEITSGSGFTLTLSPTDKAAMNQIMSKNGTSSFGGTTYNLAAAEDWIRGANADVMVTDLSGNGITVSGITGISGITLPTNATYKTGDNLDFSVQFEAAVNVTYTGEASKPYIEINLNTGGPVRAYYQSGSGTSTLVFRYTVTSGEADSDGIALVSPINPNTGAIKNASDISASLYFTSPSTANIKVDGVAPTVASVSSTTANGSYKAGDIIAISVIFNDNVTITGTPRLTLETGSTDRMVSYASGSGTSTLRFDYTVQPGDTSVDLDYLAENALALNLGSIRDAGGNDAVLTLPAPGEANSLGANKAIVIDTTAPGITAASCALSVSNAYIDVVFTEPVYGAADGITALTAARFALTFTQNGGTVTNAVISSVKQNDNTVEGSASALIGGETIIRVFLTITGTPNGLETIEIKPANGTSVYDKAGNAMLAAQTTGFKTLNDLTPPTLLSAVWTDNTHITVTLSKNSVNIAKANDGGFTVNETGAPGTTYAVTFIAQGSDASHVVLTVADTGVSAREGVTVKYMAAGNGTVQDTLGNVMLTNGAGIGVTAWDTAAPVISSSTLSSGNTYIDVVFSEGVYGAADGTSALTAGNLALTFTQNGGTATNAVISAVKQNDNTAEGSASALTGGETTVRIFLTITGTPNGIETIELKPANAASVYDKGGNAALASQTTGVKLLNDPTPPTPPSEDNGANVVVNGENYSAGSSQNSTNDQGQNVTTVTVDTKKLQDILENQGAGAIVTIPVTTGSDVASGVLTGLMVDTMEQNGATLVIETATATYTLPAAEINIGAVAEQLGENVTLADIVVTVSVSAPSGTMTTVIEDAASDGDFMLVVPAVEFTVSCTYNGQTVDVTSFNAYVERTIRIPDGVDPSKITTAVVVEPDGTTRHVPTQITVIDGEYYAVINSLTNSVYSVIWNPIEFADADSSWAKDAINSMGSRMVITGVGDNRFEPDRDITRAEFAAIVVRALGLPTGAGNNNFADVKAGVWYCPYIETAVSYGLIAGCSDGLFHPEDAITREQAMTLIQRAMRLTGLEKNLTAADISTLLQAFPDRESVSGYAEAGVAACVKTGIVLGKYGQLAPGDFITRAEVAVIIQRLLEKSNLI